LAAASEHLSPSKVRQEDADVVLQIPAAAAGKAHTDTYFIFLNKIKLRLLYARDGHET